MRWFEPEKSKIRRMKLGLLLASILLFGALIFALLSLIKEKLSLEDKLLIGIFLPFWILYLIQFVNSYKLLDNRLGFDGKNVYIKSYTGEIWIGTPSQLVFSGKILAGSNFLVYIKDRYLNPLYSSDQMEKINSILSQATHMNPLKFELFYLLKRGDFSIRLFLIYLPLSLILALLILLWKYFFKSL